MYTTAALLDVHARTHRSLRALLEHLGSLPVEALHTPRTGFSQPTVAGQLHHVLGAERYWMGVLQGLPLPEDDEAAHRSVEALQALEATVGQATRTFLGSLSDAEASAPRQATRFDGVGIEVVPAHVVLRTQTHAYQHQGEIATLLRQLGHTFPSRLDFPLA